MQKGNIKDKLKKESEPTSLWHYTSFETLTKILNPNNECLIKKQMLSFRLGNPIQTNDKKEIHFFDDYVYDGKCGNELKQQIDGIREQIGMPFILSLIHHIETHKGYPSCEIPMWRMYGNQFKGVRLKFDYKKMKDYYKLIDNVNLEKCIYLTVNEIKNKGKEIRYSLKQLNENFDFENVYKASATYKTYDWVYENEWRIIAWCNNINMIDFNEQTGRLFIPYEIPLDFLNAIEIGPKADYDACKCSLELIKEKIGNIPENHFDIKQSKLKIGYV